MNRCVWIVAFLLSALPAFAQDPAESALREIGMGEMVANGDLALRAMYPESKPVEELKALFTDAKLPINKDQERQLKLIVDDQQKAMQTSMNSTRTAGSAPRVTNEEMQKLNRQYMTKVNAVLTPEQQTAWRKYRIEQIKLRGGFAALKLILEDANVPFATDQENKIQTIYANFNVQRAQLNREFNGRPDPTKLIKVEDEELAKVVVLLTPDQKKALLASRRPSSTGRGTAPKP